ncbi:TetR/AcrR family transcriptional regulator [Beijerinckia sp. L45]|uniref:TetR/AcrR family transcriptional regulator n=1 Tax=Beijerinckia sp. L45 TaxID=1641855 RepID=UPI00131DF8F0|nr:TetR/AcrR family transcriptional regulator [Beijerinckia sp. L45]
MRDTRGELLFEAEILIRGRGYSGFSYADLASAVGIRKASIHHHFPTKTDLAMALIAAYGERYDTALARIEAQSTLALARVEAYGDLYLDGVEQGLGCLCAVMAAELVSLPDPLRAAIAAFFAKHIAWLETTLQEGCANGSIRPSIDPAAHARMIVATLEGALMMERVLAGASGFRSVLAALRDGLAP